MSKKSYYFMSANFETCDFEQLFLKYSNHGIIRWQKNNHNIKKDDIVFIYYCNMPDKISRIMLRGVVTNSSLENDTVMEIKVEGLNYSVDIKNNNKMKFSTNNLKNKYGVKCFQGCFELNKQGNKHNESQRKLIEDLNKFQYTSFENIKNRYFTTNCYFEKKNDLLENEYLNHPTFKKNNGLSYMECHHFIYQSIISKYPDVFEEYDSLVYNDLNEVNLCSNCHNKIHYANDKDRKIMIDIILKERNRYIKFQEIWSQLKASKYYEKEQYSCLEDFIYSLYKISLEKEK